MAGPYTELKKYRPQDWNEMEVIVQGDTATCTCNGEPLQAGDPGAGDRTDRAGSRPRPDGISPHPDQGTAVAIHSEPDVVRADEPLRLHTSADERVARPLGWPPGSRARLWRYLYREGVQQFDVMLELPSRLRERLSREASIFLTVASEIDSDDGQTQKYLLAAG